MENTSKLSPVEKDFVEFLKEYHTGADNAITDRRIRRTFLVNVNSRRLRRIVHRLRLVGYPIGSSNHGYYYVENEEELKPTIRLMQSRILELQEVVKALRETRYAMQDEKENYVLS